MMLIVHVIPPVGGCSLWIKKKKKAKIREFTDSPGERSVHKSTAVSEVGNQRFYMHKSVFYNITIHVI